MLGSGDFLDISQGDFVTLGLSASWRWRNLEANLTGENLTNETKGQFALAIRWGL